jgi:Na+-transporting methylmalonyl-CoA/oxaloacetate decarboxylase gamma subunit
VITALWIVLLGMAIIFAAMGILFVIITLLDRLIRTREKKEVKG